jgi:hypothetical protein
MTIAPHPNFSYRYNITIMTNACGTFCQVTIYWKRRGCESFYDIWESLIKIYFLQELIKVHYSSKDKNFYISLTLRKKLLL